MGLPTAVVVVAVVCPVKVFGFGDEFDWAELALWLILQTTAFTLLNRYSSGWRQ